NCLRTLSTANRDSRGPRGYSVTMLTGQVQYNTVCCVSDDCAPGRREPPAFCFQRWVVSYAWVSLLFLPLIQTWNVLAWHWGADRSCHLRADDVRPGGFYST